jgi:hypothetical protein
MRSDGDQYALPDLRTRLASPEIAGWKGSGGILEAAARSRGSLKSSAGGRDDGKGATLR